MLFRASTITTALSLLTLSAALPTTRLSSSSTLTTRDDTQCKPGTSFYTCFSSQFRGCCS
ncbi:hypothetical protein BBP40_010963, partial [Aspergillus hancockii]